MSDFYDAFDKPEPQPRPHVVPVNPADAQPYAAKALAKEVVTLANTPQGQRNDQLNTSGFNLAQLVAGGYLQQHEAWNALYTTALGIGLTEHETTNTLRSAFEAGKALPRIVPDLDTHDAPQASVYTPQDATEDTEPPNLDALFPVLNWHDLWADTTEDEWVLEPLLPARRLVALFSPPKVGKSLLLLEIAVAVARGTQCLGVTPDRPRRVLYVDFENDPRGDVRTRLQAMGFGPDDLGDLVYLSFPSLPYLDTSMGGLQLLALCQHHRIEVVVIDTISRAVQGEENDNDTWLAFYRNTGVRLKGEGIATIRLDHTGKDAAKGMRGGSAKYGDVDAVWAMTRITEEQYKLECTANRLPIAEKELTVNRLYNPLRHAVDTTGRNAAWEQAVDATVAAIAALDPVPPVNGDGSGVKAIYPLVRHHPQVTKRSVEAAVKRRRHAPTAHLYTPPEN